ncbi:MAG: glycosyltransferase family 87 protein [Candidatus Dormiibacterota bacterium]
MRPAFIAQAGLIGSALAIYILVLAQAGVHHQDLDAYLTAGRAIWQGQPLYAPFLHHPFPDPTLRPAFIYPPAFALLVAPLGLLPDAVANVVWLLIGQASLAAALGLTLRWLQPSPMAVTAMLFATLTFYPVWVDAVQGQANLLILLLLIGGIAGIVQGKPGFGLALGAAAALKLTPVILLAWLLLDRRIREAAWMVGGLAAVTAAAALLRFGDTLVFFGQVLPALASGTAYYANQSLAGVVARLFSANSYTTPWLALSWAFLVPAAGAVLLSGLWFVRTRNQPALVRAVAFIPLLPLLSTVTWPHHLVILLPVFWIGAIALAERDWPVAPTIVAAGLLLTFSVVTRWTVGPAFGQMGFRAAQTTDVMVFLVANAFFLGTLILFLLAPWLLRAR